MGKTSSKFRKYIQNGDEESAYQLLSTNSELRKCIDPNAVYKGNQDSDTPLHCVCRHAMKSIIRIFVSELGGDVNKRNALKQTALHCVCCVDANAADQEDRLQCLKILLALQETQCLDLSAADDKGNTALHYAAMAGMKDCVQLLVSHGASLYVENNAHETPCDCAERNSQPDIALYLESKMVFSDDPHSDEDFDNSLASFESDEHYLGLRHQELQQEKDQLLVETSDMLQVPLFTAEALLRGHEWCREILLESWITDPVACCNKCGVLPPKTILTGPHCTASVSKQLSLTGDVTCEICLNVIPSHEEPIPMPCHHQFCKACWEQYLSVKIMDGEAHSITCPGYNCNRLVPVDVIEALVSRDMARRYLQFDIKAFVESNPGIKWCPHPGCGRAVKMPLTLNVDNSLTPITSTGKKAIWSHSVDCGNGHTFCWDCMSEAHEPASCEHWKNWHQKIAEIKPEELNGTEEELENSANCLWLVTNSKPCSSCKSPIQKNEGCNHMKCSKCKHDFCWVCLESWKKHSTATGGYFRCNRYEVVKKVLEQHDSLKTQAELNNRKVQELNRFVHYYSRFKNHEISYKLELPLYQSAKDKMLQLARAVLSDEDLIQQQTGFIHEAVNQLLKARHVLKCSYVYGYYLEQTGYKKPIFEFMQTELEESVETLSQMVSRSYMRTPRSKIIQAAHRLQQKRFEFLSAITSGLVPPDMSPSLKKKSKIFTVEVDEATRKALLTSLHKDPHASWVKVPSGKHTNISALLDWPDDAEDDSDCETLTSQQSSSQPPSDASLAASHNTGVCKKSGCQRQCVVSPRTGELQEYCSMKCKNLDTLWQDNAVSLSSTYAPDYEMDLLRAVEMSRLQFLSDTARTMAVGLPDNYPMLSQHKHRGDDMTADGRLCGTSDMLAADACISTLNPVEEEELQLQKALALSLCTMPKEEQDDNVAVSTHGASPTVFDVASFSCATNSDDAIGDNTFGAIKDLRVNNIVASDADKTFGFDSKNLKQLFHSPDSQLMPRGNV